MQKTLLYGERSMRDTSRLAFALALGLCMIASLFMTPTALAQSRTLNTDSIQLPANWPDIKDGVGGYGLSASIWTRDIDRPLRVARDVDAGTIWINDWAIVWDEFEEGGFKRSGNGRLNGMTAIDDFLEYKHLAFNSGALAAASVARA